MKKEYTKDVNKSAFEIFIGDEVATEGTEYTFQYQAHIAGSQMKSKAREG